MLPFAKKARWRYLLPAAMLAMMATFASPVRAAERLELRVETPEGWQKQTAGAGLVLRPQGGGDAGAQIRIESHDGVGLDAARVSRAVSDSYLAIDRDADIPPPTAIETRAAGSGLQFQILYAADHVSRAAWVVIVGGADKGGFYALHYSAPESAFAAHRPIAQTIVERMSWASRQVTSPGSSSSHRCDELAAHPNDPGKPRNVRGVDWNRLLSIEAIAACEQALAADPSQMRWAYQLARALYKAERYSDAMARLAGPLAAKDSMARLLLATAHEEGNGVARESERAFRIRLELAEAGHAFAMFTVALGYELGTGVKRNRAAAIGWYERAAAAGDLSAMNDLGNAYNSGAGVPLDKVQGIRWLKKAAEGGSALAMYNLGLQYRDESSGLKNYAESLELFRKAAELGNADAQAQVGFAFANGLGFPHNKPEAARLYRVAAKSGSLIGKFLLGISYRDGEGVNKNLTEALNWLEEADLEDFNGAAFVLAQMHYQGLGTAADPAKAADYMIRALSLGDKTAQREMTANAASWSLAFRREMQTQLKKRGVYSGPIDGTFGPAVARALAALSDRGITP
jgi:TPR repeat protein